MEVAIAERVVKKHAIFLCYSAGVSDNVHDWDVFGVGASDCIDGGKFTYTEGGNETVEVNRTTWSWTNITIADGQSWTQPYTFSIGTKGLWKIQFLLFKGDAPTEQTLHFYVTIV